MSKRKKSLTIYIFLGTILFSGFMVYKMVASETKNGLVNLVLKKDNKVYVYSNTGEFIAQNSIKNGESPPTMAFIHMYEEDEDLYIDPSTSYLKDIANLFCGNFQIHRYVEKSSDGYITSEGGLCFESSYKNRSTENIGEQVQINMVTLKDGNGKTYNIQWETNKRTYESKAIQNCYEKSFQIKTSVQPGEFVIASKDFIMINLQDVANFYGNKIELRLDKEAQLLYLEHKN